MLVDVREHEYKKDNIKSNKFVMASITGTREFTAKARVKEGHNPEPSRPVATKL